MNHGILACGPYFDESGMVASLVLFLLIKPLSYYAYIRAFRYRVCADIPMTVKQAVGLAALRAVLGLVMVGGAAFLIINWLNATGFFSGWIFLYFSRIFAWWIVGKVAKLRGWRMVGWIAGGEAINIVFDLGVVFGLATGILPAIGAVAVIAAFIYVLEWRGRRPELVARFSSCPCCRVCQYNLTGNLSGICPECGTQIVLQPAFAPAVS